MIRIGDRYLADSIPILEWMESEIPDGPLLPADEPASALVRERMAWIDRNAFRAMVGLYYGTAPDRIARAAELLADALAEMGQWTEATGWLAGPDVTLADAVAIPIHVRLAGLQQLGFTAELPPSFAAHRKRCQALHGWAAVAWSAEQCDEFVGRFSAYRRKHLTEVNGASSGLSQSVSERLMARSSVPR